MVTLYLPKVVLSNRLGCDPSHANTIKPRPALSQWVSLTQEAGSREKGMIGESAARTLLVGRKVSSEGEMGTRAAGRFSEIGLRPGRILS
jgi:hypothetical protein